MVKIYEWEVSEKMKYRMSYVLGGLFYTETLKIFKVYSEEGNWPATRERVLSENRLNANMKRSAKRIYQEIELRLKTLTKEELTLLERGTAEEKRQLLWLACCKSYRFLYELTSELINEKRLTGETVLACSDYEAFYTQKAMGSEALQNLTASTRQKLRSVAFRILREADILNQRKEILPQLLTPELEAVIKADDPALLKIYP